MLFRRCHHEHFDQARCKLNEGSIPTNCSLHFVKPYALIAICLVFASMVTHGQDVMSGIAYRDIETYKSREALDTITFEAHYKYDNFILERYKLKTVESHISQYYLQDHVLMVYNPEYLFLNLSLVGISNGFVKIPSPKTYNYFIGRPQKGDFNETQFVAGMALGLAGAAVSGGLNNETRKSVPYLFSLETGRLYPFTPETLERFMLPYPDLSLVYTTDPSKDDEETMLVYLELLNDLIDTNPTD